MFKRFSRSWQLIKASAGVLMKDKELLVFPLLSGICALIVAATFLLPMFGLGLLDDGDGGMIQFGLLVLGFLFYLVQYFCIFFFNSALVGAAMIRLDGGDPTVRDGFRIAFGKFWQILGYAAIAATVGLILRMIQERAGWLGRIIAGFLGLAWTVASFLVVPVLVSRDIGPLDAVKESALLLKKTWGENLIGQGGVGLVFGFVSGGIVLVGVLLAVAAFMLTQNLWLVAAVAVLTVLTLVFSSLVQTALSGIYSAALYRYAMHGDAASGFEPGLLEHAFEPKS